MFYINFIPDANNPGSYVPAFGGTFSRTVTADDLKLFNLNDDNRVKMAISDLWGVKPTDIFFHDPTLWDDASYAWWSWQPVTLRLQPVSVSISNVRLTDGSIRVASLSNPDSNPITIPYHNSFDVSNTATSTWSTTSSVTVSEEVGINIQFFGSQTTASYTRSWEKGGSKEFEQTLGSSINLPVVIPPNSRADVTQITLIGSADATITYQASLIGLVFANYADWTSLWGYEGKHHFFGLPVERIVFKLGKNNALMTTEIVHLSSTAWVRTDVSSSPLDQGEKQAVAVHGGKTIAAPRSTGLCADRPNKPGTLWGDRV